MRFPAFPSLLPWFSLFAFGVSLCAQGEVDSRATVKKGAVAWIVHEATIEASGAVQGGDLKTMQKTCRTLQLTVKDVDAAGNLQIETRIVRVQGQVELPMGIGAFDFDSSASEDDGSAPPGMTQQMVVGAGLAFLAKVSPLGSVVELGEGSNEILAANKDAQANMNALDRDGLIQLVADVFGSLPNKRTAGGARWQFEGVRYYGGFPIKPKMQMTLSKVDIDTFEIEGAGTVDIAKDVTTGKQGIPAEDAAELARQVESTTISNGKITRRQTTSRTDGFVATATEVLEMDIETRDSIAGPVSMHTKVTRSLRRATAEESQPKKDAAAQPAAATKK